jgi:FkbM family methyltransferase
MYDYDRLAEESIQKALATPTNLWDMRACLWPLIEDSTVVEVGGYVGRWALQMALMHHCKIFVFEPQLWAAEVCRRVLGGRATVLDYALGAEDKTLPLFGFETDGCSLLTYDEIGPPARALAKVRDVATAFEELDITIIDVMMVNIEGYEYTLIPYMLSKGILPIVLMVQYHTAADPYMTQTVEIEAQLISLGYEMVWTYGVVLSAWRRHGRSPE